jgi:streptogramin lyase
MGALRAAIVAAAVALAGCGGASHARKPTPAPTEPGTLSFTDPVDVAADRDGALWVADYRDDSLTVVRRDGARLVAVRRIAAHGGPNRLAADAHGRIWAALWDRGRLAAWEPGRAAPAVVLRVPGMRQPTGLAFDHRGWLWVTTQTGTALLGFPPHALRSSATVAPARRVPLPGGRKALNEDVAFDARDRAYVVQYQAERLVVLDPVQDAAPAPRVVVKLRGDGPVGIRRAPDGAIWVTNSTAANLLRVTDGGHRRRVVTTDGANMPHTVTFVGGQAYVTDPTAWVLGYRVGDLESGTAEPTLVANP